jgi:hypothetical protein
MEQRGRVAPSCNVSTLLNFSGRPSGLPLQVRRFCIDIKGIPV